MKKYIKPVMEVSTFSFEGMIATSVVADPSKSGDDEGSNRYNLNESWDDIEED